MLYVIVFTFLICCFILGSVIGFYIQLYEILKKVKLKETIEELNEEKELLSSQIALRSCELKKLEYSYFQKLSEFNTLNTEIGVVKTVKKAGKKK